MRHLFINWFGASHSTAVTIEAILSALLLIGFVLISAIFFIWLERKVAGRIQDRLGPTRVGGRFGWLQTLADGVKLLLKEDLIPKNADQMLFRLGPYVAFVGAFLAFIALPFGNGIVAREMNIGIFFILAVLSTEVFGVILAGYGSGSKWSLFGGMREAAQVVSYEVPMAICVIIPVIVGGTMSMTELGVQQAGWFWEWRIFHDPITFVAFWTYFTCAVASCKRAPFDLAEAESELVAGFHTEYSGLRWSFFFMAEYGAMFAVAGIAIILFLGGWHLGIPIWSFFGLPADPSTIGGFWGVVFNLMNMAIFIVKGWILVFVMMWVRWTLPRLRIDQVMMTCLKYLLPISCFLLLAISLWGVAWSPDWIKYPLAFGSVVLVVLVLGKLIFTKSEMPVEGASHLWGKPGPKYDLLRKET